eukprot:1105921-Pleurochrysis_carterae.AAC.1
MTSECICCAVSKRGAGQEISDESQQEVEVHSEGRESVGLAGWDERGLCERAFVSRASLAQAF